MGVNLSVNFMNIPTIVSPLVEGCVEIGMLLIVQAAEVSSSTLVGQRSWCLVAVAFSCSFHSPPIKNN